MRKKDRKLTEKETRELFENAEYGILSLVDKQNRPYGVPVNFALKDNNIYIHCSSAGGKKIEALKHNPNASFTVVTKTKILPERFTTLYLSGIAKGKVSIVSNVKEKRTGIDAIVKKYAPDYINESIDFILPFKEDPRFKRIFSLSGGMNLNKPPENGIISI